MINRVCRQQLIELTRQPSRPVGENPRNGLKAFQQTKGKDAIDKALSDLKASQNRRATVACSILFCAAPGLQIICFVLCFYYITAVPPNNPDVGVLYVLRNSQTARDWVNATRRLVGRPLAEGLGRTHATAWCGGADAVDEASRDDMGGPLG